VCFLRDKLITFVGTFPPEYLKCPRMWAEGFVFSRVLSPRTLGLGFLTWKT